MRDPTAQTITNHALIDEMITRRIHKGRRKTFPFNYNWRHESTGNSGTGIIHMPDRPSLVEWVARWNHSNFANGWVYSLPE